MCFGASELAELSQTPQAAPSSCQICKKHTEVQDHTLARRAWLRQGSELDKALNSEPSGFRVSGFGFLVKCTADRGQPMTLEACCQLRVETPHI